METPDFFDFHEAGNPACDACMLVPVACECGRGLVHTQFDKELEVIEGRCDHCKREKNGAQS